MKRFTTTRFPFSRKFHHLTLVIAVTCAGTASQQAFSQFPADDKANEQIYQVEVIVFTQPGATQNEEEVWRTDIQLDYPLNWRELLSPAQLSAAANEAGSLGDNPASDRDAAEQTALGGLQAGSEGSDEEIIDPSKNIGEQAMLLLPEEDFILKDQARRLSRNRQRILFHGAWHQPMVEDRDEPSILISGGELFDEHHELEGSINVYLRNYLHIKTDLWLSRFATNFGQEGRPWPKLPWPPNRPPEPGKGIKIDDGGTGLWHQFNQNRNDEYEAILAQPYVVENVVLVQQSRRMRSSELHYIDHPEVGILIKVIPYEEEEAASEEEPAPNP